MLKNGKRLLSFFFRSLGDHTPEVVWGQGISISGINCAVNLHSQMAVSKESRGVIKADALWQKREVIHLTSHQAHHRLCYYTAAAATTHARTDRIAFFNLDSNKCKKNSICLNRSLLMVKRYFMYDFLPQTSIIVSKHHWSENTVVSCFHFFFTTFFYYIVKRQLIDLGPCVFHRLVITRTFPMGQASESSGQQGADRQRRNGLI